MTCIASASLTSDFNPRAPHGARLAPFEGDVEEVQFQSTRSAWSATSPVRGRCRGGSISIHALRMERDSSRPSTAPPTSAYFNPRAPHGARPPCVPARQGGNTHFNPRAPHGARLFRFQQATFFILFQSTRSAWSATGYLRRDGVHSDYFNPRAPHGARQQKTTNHIRNYVAFYNNKNINFERKLF